jgi:hypothetical protein
VRKPESSSALVAKATAREDHLFTAQENNSVEGFRALVFAESKYLPYLANHDLSDQEKTELLKALWNVLIGFMDLGFKVVSQSEITCASEFSVESDGHGIVPSFTDNIFEEGSPLATALGSSND